MHRRDPANARGRLGGLSACWSAFASSHPGGTSMAVRVDLNISLDGFATTTDQTPEDPFGPDWARLVEAYVGDPHVPSPSAAGDVRRGHDRRRRPVRAGVLRRGRRGDHGRRHVRAPRRRGRSGLARLVGRRASVPCPGVRAHPPAASGARDGGRHDVPLPRRDPARGARPRAGGRGRQGRADRRRPDRGRASSSRPDSSTGSTSRSSRSCSAAASGSGTTSAGSRTATA